MKLSAFFRNQTGGTTTGGTDAAVHTCISQLRSRDISDLASFIQKSAEQAGQPPADFAKACRDNLKINTEKDRDLQHRLTGLLQKPDALPENLPERAILPERRDDGLSLRASLNIGGDNISRDRSETVPITDMSPKEDAVRRRRSTDPQPFVDRKNYETSVVKRNQAPRVVKHALAHPNDARTLFSKYINSGKSGPESRLNKLHDEITNISDPASREAMLSDFIAVLADKGQLLGHALTHLDTAEALFATHVARDSRPEASLHALARDIGQLYYTDANKLASVLDRVLEGMAADKGAKVAASLLNTGRFNADFSQVSAENPLSSQEGLKQLSADMDRGVVFEAGVSLSTLSEDAKAFVGRFANQQSAAALVTSGALNIGDKVNDLLEGSGFRLDGWNSADSGVSYNVSVSESNAVFLSIPTTIAIKPTVMSSVESLPIFIATLEMSMTPVTSGGYTYAVSVTFSPLS